jgi:heat shock protein HslJ
MNTKIAAACLLAATILITACRERPDPTGPDELVNSTYLTRATTEGVVTLVGGSFDFPPGGDVDRVEFITAAQGDFDGDEDLDAAVVLVEYSDREEFYHLHALIKDGHEAQDVAERFLGDRVVVEGVRVADGIVEVDMLIRPAGSNVETEPSVPITSRYAVTDRGLTPINPPTLSAGSPRALGAGAEADLSSHEWVLQSIEMGDWSQSMDALERRPTLRFATELGTPDVGTGRVSGFAGCNQIFGGYSTQEGGTLGITALGATRRMCDESLMEVEQRVIASLGAAESIEIAGDQLVITFNGGIMRFTAGQEIEPAAAVDLGIPRGEREGTTAPEARRGRQT